MRNPKSDKIRSLESWNFSGAWMLEFEVFLNYARRKRTKRTERERTNTAARGRHRGRWPRLRGQRKDFEDQCRGRDQELLSRLFDVRHYLARLAGRARWIETFPAPNSVRHERTRRHAQSQAHQVRENRRRD